MSIFVVFSLMSFFMKEVGRQKIIKLMRWTDISGTRSHEIFRRILPVSEPKSDSCVSFVSLNHASKTLMFCLESRFRLKNDVKNK